MRGSRLFRERARGVMTAGLLAICLGTIPLAAQSVSYRLEFPNATHHEARITAVFDGLPLEPVEITMSRSSPGRYALHEFIRNVYDESFTNGAGEPVEATRVDPYRWVVPDHDGTIEVTYTLFGSLADGTYSRFTSQYLHMNGPATYLWTPDLTDAPIQITFVRPNPEWTIATQLFPTDDPETFTAPNQAYLMDSPVHIGSIAWREWVAEHGDESATIRLAVDHTGTDEQLDRFAEKAKEIVRQQIEMWDDLPDFDDGTYTFIATYRADVDGDGMEHRNSTMLTSSKSIEKEEEDLLQTVSHEFMHAWNVERLRPASLEPFDFSRANMSAELWFAEGFTSYYDGLFMRRAGLVDDEKWAKDMTSIIDFVVNSPGRAVSPASEMSMRAPFVDAAASIDSPNWTNTFVSYYTWGAAIGLGLDLTLRAQSGITLDAYMREVWARFGRTERPYTIPDLEATLADVTGDPAFAGRFFSRFIEGSDVVDYSTLLERGGFELRLERRGQSWLGARVQEDDGRVVISTSVRRGSPFWDAGLEKEDTILEIDENKVSDPGYLQAVADLVPPGTELSVKYERAGQEGTTTLRLSEDPSIEVVPFEKAEREITDEMRAFRLAWLGEAPAAESDSTE